jgi:hypothetical protein
MLSAVFGVFRVHEIRLHYLIPLLGVETVESLGLLDIKSFVGDWEAFTKVRNAWAAHATANRPKSSGTSVGRWLDPFYFGQLLGRSGLDNEAEFLRRVEDELLPSVEATRAYLFEKYPSTREYLAQYRMAKGIMSGKARTVPR